MNWKADRQCKHPLFSELNTVRGAFNIILEIPNGFVLLVVTQMYSVQIVLDIAVLRNFYQLYLYSTLNWINMDVFFLLLWERTLNKHHAFIQNLIWQLCLMWYFVTKSKWYESCPRGHVGYLIYSLLEVVRSTTFVLRGFCQSPPQTYNRFLSFYISLRSLTGSGIQDV